ncbi:MAG: Unknown protein [uncultured Thiotrichaceae bacterium]|uniref:DUF1840 domain-containing protein n=1 Tax=uncultured Thiotrichaceae bacterium TaxID=298394 RepID=A0A6S6T4P6_9GAMM|nr:MAG: Unknown protein [uncultured Thiotrichaceae bacterium]
MLIRFSSKTGSSITMHQKQADMMLEMMKRSGKIPGALKAEDVPAALDALEAAILIEKEKESATNMDDDDIISIGTRAYPLLQLLKQAIKDEEFLMWDYEDKLV